MVVVDADGRIRRCNEGLIRLLGLSEPPIGRKMASFLAADEEHAHSWALGRSRRSLATAEGVVISVMVSVVDEPDGRALIVEQPKALFGEIFDEMSRLQNELSRTNRELQRKIKELEAARDQIKVLGGLLPICSFCKSIRDDDGYWNQLEGYLAEHSEAMLTHSVCPTCMDKHYPEPVEEESADSTS
jgi:PAS domain-containing protein